jgi:DNA-binding transcriptional ArsR family regulator
LPAEIVSSNLPFVAAYQVFDALGDPTRRQILEELGRGPAPVGQIAARLPISRPAVSQHLRVLERAGLVTHESVGTRNVYRVDADGLAALRRWLDRFWATALESFTTYVDHDNASRRQP